MHFTFLFALTVAFITNASPIARRSSQGGIQRRTLPMVNIDSGTIIGSSDLIIESYKGIPYAQPPVGNLRLRPPQPIVGSLGVINAVGIPRACPQFNVIPDVNELLSDVIDTVWESPLFQTITNQGEDCLTLDVQRPAGNDTNVSLPVLVWIFGGGFEVGATEMYNGASLVKRGIELGGPFVYVQMNYRVSGFGFLAGKELQEAGSTNLGLRDQRLALEWVQDNIAAFGGDPKKVTIWGESAGAISVFDHTIINGGDNAYKNGTLFRGAIMDSGSTVPADTVSAPQAQAVYDQVVEAAGCSSAADTLNCLRNVDYETFLNATNAVPGIFSYRSVDLSYLPRPDPADDFFPVSPEIALRSGAYTKVPVIIGDQEDEGTLFSLTQANITTNEQLVLYLASYFPSTPNAEELVRGLVATYPDNIGVSGSPFRTGLLNNIYPQFKRLAAILGDVVFTLTRRSYLYDIAGQVPAWSYLSSYFYGTAILGTFHGSDLIYSFGLLGPATVPTISIQSYYISFVNKLDPNALGTSAPLIEWPQWKEQKELLNFQVAINELLADDFREESFEYLRESASGFRV